jgi:hypothetical protein
MNDENHIGLDVQQATNPKTALGHEPQRDPWLTPYKRSACPVSELIGVVATHEDVASITIPHSRR